MILAGEMRKKLKIQCREMTKHRKKIGIRSISSFHKRVSIYVIIDHFLISPQENIKPNFD